MPCFAARPSIRHPQIELIFRQLSARGHELFKLWARTVKKRFNHSARLAEKWRKKIRFLVCWKVNFAGYQTHRKLPEARKERSCQSFSASRGLLVSIYRPWSEVFTKPLASSTFRANLITWRILREEHGEQSTTERDERYVPFSISLLENLKIDK